MKAAPPTLWPELHYDAVAPTVEYLHRIAQIAAKYTLDRTFERSWGHIVLPITPRGFTTPLLRSGDVLFSIEFALLDCETRITASSGHASLNLATGSVSTFYASFLAALKPLGIPAPRSTVETEMANAMPFSDDTETRPFDAAAARSIWGALASASEALCAYQAPYFGPRPPVGIMWGGFDLSATRYNGRSKTPPEGKPIFQRNGMNSEEVAVGFSFGDDVTKTPAFYAYIAPEPEAMSAATFGVPEAAWIPTAGLVSLPYSAVRAKSDPMEAVVRFADAVYDVAVEHCGWPSNMTGPREDGWYASRKLIRYS